MLYSYADSKAMLYTYTRFKSHVIQFADSKAMS